MTGFPRFILRLLLWLALLPQSSGPAAMGTDPVYGFDDFPLREPLEYPSWFKKSLMDLPDDLAEAVAAGKRGIILYFGQARCAYCQKLLEVNFGLSDILTYTRRHFDLIPLDIWGLQSVTDLQGNHLSERELAMREHTNFTPSLIFYDREGKEVLRLRGYYPPYQLRAALEYVADGHYRTGGFPEYLARGEGSFAFEPGELNEEEDLFVPPPYNLDRSHFPSERPLVVFFERGDCHACDVLHNEPLRDPAIRGLLQRFDNVQLDMGSDIPVVSPDGQRTTAKQWARALGLFYAPAILFFDEWGKEIIRVDSVVRFYRLRNVLNYINSKGYLTEPNYQRWRHDAPS